MSHLPKKPENWVCQIIDAIDENMRQVAIAANAKEAASILTILKPYIPHLFISSLPIILTKNIMRTTFTVRAPTIERKTSLSGANEHGMSQPQKTDHQIPAARDSIS